MFNKTGRCDGTCDTCECPAEGASELKALLCAAGFEVATDADSVLQMISDKAGPPGPSLCSGYGVFPDGKKCGGCADCST